MAGRQKLHYLNPVPLHEISGRWLRGFDHPRLDALDRVRHRAEESLMTDRTTEGPDDEERPTFRCTTYVRATPETVWRALTDADLTAAYWGHANVSDWVVGSGWEHRRTDGSGVADVVGTVLESAAPQRLSITFDAPGDNAEDPSVVTFVIEAIHEICRLNATHTRIPSLADREEAARGWSAVLSNLKTPLETGAVLPQAPRQMVRGLEEGQSVSESR